MSTSNCIKIIIFVFIINILPSYSYLPGFAPINYCPPDVSSANCQTKIKVLANVLSSPLNIIKYEYKNLGFCVDEDYELPNVNLGQILGGERIEATTIETEYPKGSLNAVSCNVTYKPNDKKYDLLYNSILKDYSYQLMVDGLPVVVAYTEINSKTERYQKLIPVGCYTGNRDSFCLVSLFGDHKPDSAYIFNHIALTIEYHRYKPSAVFGHNISDKAIRIVGVKAIPGSNSNSNPDQPLLLPEKITSDFNIKFTYSVNFKENLELEWSSRWDYLLKSSPQSNIQWLSLFNSFLILLFLTALIAFIIIKALRRDINRYNELDNLMESQDDFGWKLVHADVFRPPRGAMMLSVFTGFGMQTFCMAFCTLFFAFAAFSKPSYRGSILTMGMASFVLFAIVGGYTSSRLYKLMGGINWKTNVLFTALFCPSVIFIIYIIINIVLAVVGSSEAIPFGTLIGVLAMWLLVSLPLCFVGSFIGFRKPAISTPLRTNQIPRQIPKQSTLSRFYCSTLFSGSLPFGCIFVEIYMMLSSLWGTEIYYMFGYMFLIFIIFIICTAESAILMCYFQLCAEDYRWWWTSFISVGSSAIFLFCYSIHFFVVKVNYSDSTSAFLYFAYVSIITWLFFLMTGTIGTLVCLAFVRKIYSLIKVD